MKWSIHIYDPKTETTTTHVKDYPGMSASMADAPSVVAKASRDFKKHMKYILAVPHHEGHATKRKAPAQLDREIAAHLRPGYDNSPGAWQQGYDYAQETSRHETRAEQRDVLRRVAPGASEYDRGYMAGYQDVLGIAREKRSHATRNGGSTGYEVSRTALGKTRSAVFTSRAAAEKFQAANEGSRLKEVQLDSRGKIVKGAHAQMRHATVVAPKIPSFKVSTKAPASMTASEINKELDKLSAQDSTLGTLMIEAGRGYERPSEYLKMTDPLAMEFRKNSDRRSDLRNEISLRYGPNHPSRLPSGRGFGPRSKSY